MEVVVTTGAISHVKLQSNHHHQQTNTQIFTCMLFLSKHWRKNITFQGLAHSNLTWGLPTSSWIQPKWKQYMWCYWNDGKLTSTSEPSCHSSLRWRCALLGTLQQQSIGLAAGSQESVYSKWCYGLNINSCYQQHLNDCLTHTFIHADFSVTFSTYDTLMPILLLQSILWLGGIAAVCWTCDQ